MLCQGTFGTTLDLKSLFGALEGSYLELVGGLRGPVGSRASQGRPSREGAGLGSL